MAPPPCSHRVCLASVCHVSGLHRRRAIDGHDVRPGWAYPAATDGWFEHQPPAPIGAEGELQVDIRADCMYYLRVITGQNSGLTEIYLRCSIPILIMMRRSRYTFTTVQGVTKPAVPVGVPDSKAFPLAGGG
jgi:hypothetical protein